MCIALLKTTHSCGHLTKELLHCTLISCQQSTSEISTVGEFDDPSKCPSCLRLPLSTTHSWISVSYPATSYFSSITSSLPYLLIPITLLTSFILIHDLQIPKSIHDLPHILLQLTIFTHRFLPRTYILFRLPPSSPLRPFLLLPELALLYYFHPLSLLYFTLYLLHIYTDFFALVTLHFLTTILNFLLTALILYPSWDILTGLGGSQIISEDGKRIRPRCFDHPDGKKKLFGLWHPYPEIFEKDGPKWVERRTVKEKGLAHWRWARKGWLGENWWVAIWGKGKREE